MVELLLLSCFIKSVSKSCPPVRMVDTLNPCINLSCFEHELHRSTHPIIESGHSPLYTIDAHTKLNYFVNLSMIHLMVDIV